MTMEKSSSGLVNISKVDFLLPPIPKSRPVIRDESRSHNLPVYVKHGYPEVFRKKTDYYDHLPKIPQLPGPEAEETYGLMYHKPETEAEIKMHDLWIARRRQETFEWKSQQQLSLVLDRLSLHKSRLESDLLRRHESGAYLRGEDTRPKSANAKPEGNALTNRFAPITDYSRSKNRILSAQSRGASASAKLGSANRIKTGETEVDPNLPQDEIYEDTGTDIEEEGEDANLGPSVTVKVMKNGVETEQTLNQSVRKVIRRASRGSNSSIPMRFKTPIPLSYTQEHYMELSDSEDEGDELGENGRFKSRARLSLNSAPNALSTSGKVKPITKKGPITEAGVKIQFKREKNINRERPVSGAMFRTLADIDPELKVLYRYTNYRRMPLNETQQAWLDEQEKDRNKFSLEYANKLVDDQLAKATKKKDKDKDKGGKKDEKKDKDKKKEKEQKAKEAAALLKKLPKPKYKNASDFMERNFPNFGREDAEDERNENCCPMRATQINESDRVMGAFARFNIPIKESAVRNALLVPQDNPEAISLEQMRKTSLEGLMVNPLRRDLWRTFDRKSSKKGGKKKKSKK